jgi:hypothetical protein
MNDWKARLVVGAVLLVFAWKGSAVRMTWPQPDLVDIKAPQPPAEAMAWAKPVQPYLAKMTPADRAYMSNFYDALAYVLVRDGERATPILADTAMFQAFHSGSLDFAIDRKDVGKYGNLGGAIDETFVHANGANVTKLDADARIRTAAACGVLAWTFKIHGE